MTTYAFDLDGTLVDTREAVRQAYLCAGVSMPDEAWGLPWETWLEDPAAHDRKNAAYPDCLRRYAVKLPLLDVCRRLGGVVITGASAGAVSAIKVAFDCPDLAVALTGARRAEKLDFLQTVAAASQTMLDLVQSNNDGLPAKFRGVYVDDDPVTRTLIEEHTTWLTPTPEEFLLSFSQPARTPA